MTFGFFFLVVVAVFVPFGTIICTIIAKNSSFISKNSSLHNIFSNFSDIFSKKRSDNTDLSENLVFKQCLKSDQI